MKTYKQKISEALETINSTPKDYRGEVIYNNAWCSQFSLCSDISFYIFKLLGGKIS